jgi:hypothetical protein
MANELSFWRWFFVGYGHRPGIVRFADRWLLLHGLGGVTLAWLLPIQLREAANTVLLPLAGIFIGLSFAWAGNAQALMQTAEIEAMAERRAGGFREYAFTFQTAVLTILVTLGLWGTAGLGILDRPCFWSCSSLAYFFAKFFLFFSASLTLRECWHVVLGAQWLLLSQHRIKKHANESKTSRP